MSITEFIKQGNHHYDSLPDALKKSVDFVNKATQNGTDTNSYKANDNIKKVIDLSIEKMNVFLSSKQEKEPKLSKEKVKKIKATAKAIAKEIYSKRFEELPDAHPLNILDEESSQYKAALKEYKQSKRHAEKKQTSKKVKVEATHKVEELPIEIQIIKRFVSFIGKEKTAKQVMSLLDFVQKAIITKKVRKTSEYAKHIIYIQKSLADAYNVMSKSGVITIQFKNDTQENEYRAIVTDYESLKSVALIKRYINLDGKATIEKAAKLQDDIFKFVQTDNGKSDKYRSVLMELGNNLSNYTSGREKQLKIENQSLNGILTTIARGGLTALRYGAKGAKASAKFIKPIAQHVAASAVRTYHAADKKLKERESKQALNGVSNDEVMSISDAKSQKFDEIGFTGDYLKLIGKACQPTSLFMYGPGGSGKSGLSLSISDFLNKKGKSVLYVAGEQFNTPTFRELLIKTNVTGNDRFKIVKGLYTLPIRDYDVIVIDSKDSIGLLKSSEFKALRDAYPDKIWLITSQGTKAGDFTGDEKWRNEVDTLIYCEAGTASTEQDKNRWGGKASIKIF